MELKVSTANTYQQSAGCHLAAREFPGPRGAAARWPLRLDWTMPEGDNWKQTAQNSTALVDIIPWSKVLLEELTVAQLVKKSPPPLQVNPKAYCRVHKNLQGHHHTVSERDGWNNQFHNDTTFSQPTKFIHENSEICEFKACFTLEHAVKFAKIIPRT